MKNAGGFGGVDDVDIHISKENASKKNKKMCNKNSNYKTIYKKWKP